MTIAYLDLDGFKGVNDQRGHEEGDRLLALIAATVRGSLRATDIFARLGGDEFCVGVSGDRPGGGIGRDPEASSAPELGPSAGGLEPDHVFGAVAFRKAPDSPERMVRLADELMYAIKAGGGNSEELRVVD